MTTTTYRCRACGAWLETTDEQRAGLCGACDARDALRQIEAALADPQTYTLLLASIPGGYDPRKTGHGPTVVYLMADEGHLTPAGQAALMRLMCSANAYAYYAITGEPYVWAYGRRWTAAEWNAAAQNEERTESEATR